MFIYLREFPEFKKKYHSFILLSSFSLSLKKSKTTTLIEILSVAGAASDPHVYFNVFTYKLCGQHRCPRLFGSFRSVALAARLMMIAPPDCRLLNTACLNLLPCALFHEPSRFDDRYCVCYWVGTIENRQQAKKSVRNKEIGYIRPNNNNKKEKHNEQREPVLVFFLLVCEKQLHGGRRRRRR